MKKYLAMGGLVIVTVIWGGGFVASDMALDSFGPFQIMAIRFLLATILMGIISIKELKKIEKEEWKAGFFMGCALFIGFALQIIGLQYTTPSKNAFLTATNVVIVPFISFVIYRKKVNVNGIIGAILAIVGVGILSLEKNFSLGIGDGLTLICAVGFAFQIFLTSEYVEKYRATILNFVQMLTAFALSFICMILSGQTNFIITTRGVLSVIYLGVVSTTITYLIQTACQKYVDETKVAIILSLESVFGTFFSILILSEQITMRMVIGCILILTAVIISNFSGGAEIEADCAE